MPLRYRVFGGVLEAPFPFPELRSEPDEGVSDWLLTVADGAPPIVEERPVGHDELAAGIHAHLVRTPAGLRLAFDDTGTFDIEERGTRITWYPAPGSDRDLVRVDILGRVLAAAVHEKGVLCLHGSAVAIGGKAFGFLAPKGSGKSTIAMALAGRGARLLTDDTLPVDPESSSARPGVHSVRLWNDAADRFAALGEWRLGLSEKRTFDSLPDELVQHETVPVGALYELVPRPADEVPALVQRTRLSPARGAIALIQHSKLGALLGNEALTLLDRSTRVAANVPIYSLEIGRSMDSIGDVAATIAAWHS